METLSEAWTYLVGIIVPFAAGLLIRSGWDAYLKFVVALLVSGIVGLGSLWVQGGLVPAEWTAQAVVLVTAQVFVASQAVWHLFVARVPALRSWLENHGLTQSPNLSNT